MRRKCSLCSQGNLNWNWNSKKLRYNLKPLTCLWTFVSWSKLFSKKAIFCFCAWLPPSSSVSVSTLVWKNKQTNKQTNKQKDSQLITCLQETTRMLSLCTRVRRKFHHRSYLCFHTTVKIVNAYKGDRCRVILLEIFRFEDEDDCEEEI